MRIGIIGNYGHHNNGDEAILTGILKQLTEELGIPKQEIVIFSHHPEDSERRYGVQAVQLFPKRKKLLFSIFPTLFSHYRLMRTLDVLIIGGGGILMDLYKRDAPLYAMIGMLGHYAGCQVIVYGVGAGPIQTRMGAFFIRQLLKKANQISVRDNDSKQLLQSIGIDKPIEVIGDPALCLALSQQKMVRSAIKKIAVTAVPYYSSFYWPTADERKYGQYILGMARNLDALIREKGIEITFFSTKYPQDVQVTKEIAALMHYQERVTIVEENLYPYDILSLCADHDVVIGTRLHSLILGVAAKTPIIGVGYHPKVRHFLATIDQQDRYIDIASLSKHDRWMLDMVNSMETYWEKVNEDIEQIAIRMKMEASKGTQLLRVLGEKHDE